MFDSYEKLWKLGGGVLGKVYEVRCADSKRHFALKEIRIQEDSRPKEFHPIMREIAHLRMCDHPNIIRLHEVLFSARSVSLVLECMDMDLLSYLKEFGALSDFMSLQSACSQCLKGVDHCHGCGVLHRALSPRSFLVDGRRFLFKLSDFRHACRLPAELDNNDVGHVWYRAPELLLGADGCGAPADIWALGCVFAQMATGMALFRGDSEIDTLFQIFRTLGTPDEAVWSGVSGLRHFKATFPKWRDTGLAEVAAKAPCLGEAGMEMLRSCLAYGARRLESERLMAHAFFGMEDGEDVFCT